MAKIIKTILIHFNTEIIWKLSGTVFNNYDGDLPTLCDQKYDIIGGLSGNWELPSILDCDNPQELYWTDLDSIT